LRYAIRFATSTVGLTPPARSELNKTLCIAQNNIIMKNILSIIICISIAGCSSLPKPDFSAWKPAGPITAVVAAWEPAVSNGDKPMRGFGGRLYFYDQEMSRPAKVKGTIIVYAFDEEGRAFNDSKPNEGFVFDSKTLNSKGVYAKSKIGHSYNLWIPWDAAGPEGKAKKISLIVRYIPEKGASITSSQSTAYLPGRREQTVIPAQVQGQNEAIRQASATPPPSSPQALQSFNIR
jgi:hypothetical protein